jgi:hypothetical protein
VIEMLGCVGKYGVMGCGGRWAFGFAVGKRSYYQILDIEAPFTQRQLRKKYLIKGMDIFMQLGSTILTTIQRQGRLRSSSWSRKPMRL